MIRQLLRSTIPLMLALACTSPRIEIGTPTADRVYLGDSIGNASGRVADAVAIKDGRVLAIDHAR